MSTGSSDHPRSRGVYQTSSCTVISVVGSSPLARGLHHPADQPAGADGIIPARAGFTRVGLRRCGPLADHPRSRGVYGSTALTTVPTTGSSPLARGLPDGDGDGAVPGRIIPARAGFTTRKAGAETTRPDHPRSRGVYAQSALSYLSANGSSPLARGLPREASRRRGGRGDHPRSRGVYQAYDC